MDEPSEPSSDIQLSDMQVGNNVRISMNAIGGGDSWQISPPSEPQCVVVFK